MNEQFRGSAVVFTRRKGQTKKSDEPGNRMRHKNKTPNKVGWLASAGSGWISRLFFWLVNSFPQARRLAYGSLFDLIAAVTPKLVSVTMMNYGFADLDDGVIPIKLEPSEEPERYSLQLYDHVAGSMDLHQLDVLDVSCGRGGGAAYILRHLGAKHVTGLDFCRKSIAFCRRVHADDGLTFVHGDAEALPFPDGRFDVVVNIESSFCYSDLNRFLFEVLRVLKPGGYFAFADLRHAAEVNGLRHGFELSGLEALQETDITQNVRRALELDTERRASGVRRFVPLCLRTIFMTYAGVKGSRIPNLLAQGKRLYIRLLARKPKGELRPVNGWRLSIAA